LPSDPQKLLVRPATVADVNTLHRFSVDLATYEDEPDAVGSTPETLARDGFGANPQFAALIAERGATPVGFVLYTFNYSVWTAARGFSDLTPFSTWGVCRDGDVNRPRSRKRIPALDPPPGSTRSESGATRHGGPPLWAASGSHAVQQL